MHPMIIWPRRFLPYITTIPVRYDQETSEQYPNPRLYININTTPAMVGQGDSEVKRQTHG